MAKGVEDTAFYCFVRLVALNEVGGDPRRFGMSHRTSSTNGAPTRRRGSPLHHAGDLHARYQAKRGCAHRGSACFPRFLAAWAAAVARWSALNARNRTGDLPDRKTEYLLYQTLVGRMADLHGSPGRYMQKAGARGEGTHFLARSQCRV